MGSHNSCPISFDKIDENKVRIGALFIIIFSLLAGVFSLPLLMFFLALDFYARGFGKSKFSLIAKGASMISKKLAMKVSEKNAGPKKFAAKIGFVISLSSLVVFFINPIISSILLFTITVCAFLEGAFNFCVGCKLYFIILRIYNLLLP